MAIREGRIGVGVPLRCSMRWVVIRLYCCRRRRRGRIPMMLNSIGLRGVVGLVVGVGGRGREGLGEREGGILTALYVLCVVVPRRIDVACMADRGLPTTSCARAVGIWVRGRWVVGAMGTISRAVESVV